MAELSKDEITELVQTFQEMGVKSRARNREYLKLWMVEYLQAVGKHPETGDQKPSASAARPARELIVA